MLVVTRVENDADGAENDPDILAAVNYAGKFVNCEPSPLNAEADT